MTTRTETVQFPIGTYVIDTSDSGRYNRAVHRVTGHQGDRTVVEYVGALRNGHIEYAHGNRVVTHRDTVNLRKYD